VDHLTLLSPFGVAWEDLDLARLEAFFANAEEEPLAWEAKGSGPGGLRGGHVVKAVCGFANSELGGFLVLGFGRDGPGPWERRPVALPGDEPGLWLDQVVSAGVRPQPRTEWKLLGRYEDGIVGVLRVEPVDEPPALTGGGTAYERTSGRTLPVADPVELRALFDRGARAARRVESLADDAISALDLPPIPTLERATVVIAAACPGIGGPSLLRRETADVARALLAGLFAGIERGGPGGTAFTQDQVAVGAVGRFDEREFRWLVTSSRGWVGYGSATGEAPPATIVAREIEEHLEVQSGVEALSAFLIGVGAHGTAELRFRLDTDQGSMFLRRRQPLPLPDPGLFASMAREVRRFTGEPGWEP
jgi:hypothetical protein